MPGSLTAFESHKMCGSGNLAGMGSLLENTLKLLGKDTSQGYKRLVERKYFSGMGSKTILFHWSKLKYLQLFSFLHRRVFFMTLKF